MCTLLHMETNVEALGSRAPDAAVILLITDYRQHTDHRALDSTLQSLHRWPLHVWASRIDLHGRQGDRHESKNRNSEQRTCKKHINFASAAVQVFPWLNEH